MASLWRMTSLCSFIVVTSLVLCAGAGVDHSPLPDNQAHIPPPNDRIPLLRDSAEQLGIHENESSIWDSVEVAQLDGFVILVIRPVGPAHDFNVSIPEVHLSQLRDSLNSSVVTEEIDEYTQTMSTSWDIIGPGYLDDVVPPLQVGSVGSGVSDILRHVASRSLPVKCGFYTLSPRNPLSIQTPRFPRPYPHNNRCTWKLQTTCTAGILVTCPMFSLGYGDSLTVTTSQGTKVGYYGRNGPTNDIFRDTSVKLFFKSNYKKSSLGFLCLLVDLCPYDTTTTMPTTTTTTTMPTTTTTTTMPTTTTTTTMPTTTTTMPKTTTTPSTPTKTATSTTTTPTTTATTTTTTPTTTATTTTTTPTTTSTTTTSQPPYVSHPSCGLAQDQSNRIVNGEYVVMGEFPWQTLLDIKLADGTQRTCGGSLITPQWVLTAGHCVQWKVNGTVVLPTVRARLGMLKRTTKNPEVTMTAVDIVLYPTYTFADDLALIKLSDAISITNTVRPICIPDITFKSESFQGKTLKVAGWGKTENGKLSDSLRKLERDGMDAAKCKLVFGSYITEHHFCTTGPGVKHICLGDSGGPVMMLKGQRFVLVGVISFVASLNCKGNYPDGHVSVAHFRDWIRKVTGY
ncbi:serine proteinase stubble-like [Homarus americanus]|uniref:serine proteinase stubble-like n=1 Tax=Homarus americanus TaxID=6706 RepID=UPI001C439423|nr:serine proteinase stubble-like [Homarus americanus]